MTPLPIRLRLTLWNFAVLSFASIVVCVASWLLLRQGLERAAEGSSATGALGHSSAVHAVVSQATSIALLHVFARDLLMLAPFLLFFVALLGYWLSRKAIHPIADLARLARQICEHSFNLRIPVSKVNDEISDISKTLNQMLNRVDAGNRSIQDFTANAAHELRTPIALSQGISWRAQP